MVQHNLSFDVNARSIFAIMGVSGCGKSTLLHSLMGLLRPSAGTAALAARWIELAVIEAQHFALGPASISILTYESAHPNVPVIALWNAERIPR